MVKWTLVLFIVFLSLAFWPCWQLLSGKIRLSDYQTADRSSSHLAPTPNSNQEAIIQIYAAHTFGWRGLFAVHTWFAIKPAGAQQYSVLQVLGWRHLNGQSVVSVNEDVPDRIWFGNQPNLILDIRGERAASLIPKIMAAAKTYPYPMEYRRWPGPNSNTFTAYVARQVPELGLALPSNAVGKDFLPISKFIATAPSDTGYQISFYGLFGILLARDEGLEINILAFVFGINPFKLFIDWPAVGKISFNLWR